MKRNVSRLCSPLQNKIIRSCSADYSLFVCLLTGSNRLSSKNSHFQNKFKCKTVLVNMSFICLQVRNQYHVNNFVPTILDRIKWCSKAPPASQGWSCVRAKTHLLPYPWFGGSGIQNFFIFFVQDCSFTLKQKFQFEILNGMAHFGLHTWPKPQHIWLLFL